MIKFQKSHKTKFLTGSVHDSFAGIKSCSDDPNDLGINYSPTVVTTGV